MPKMCYIMKFRMKDNDDYRVIYKIGITTRNINKRLSEIVISMYNSYRYIPECCVRKYTRSEGYRKIESELHKLYSDKNTILPSNISGNTEFFEIEDEDELIEKYCELLEKYKDYVDTKKEVHPNNLIVPKDNIEYSNMEPRAVLMAKPITLIDD